MTQAAAWSPGAKQVLYTLYEFWVANGRAPDHRDLAIAIGADRRALRQLLLELQDGFAVSFAEERLQANILKAPPFSAIPTPVQAWMDGRFFAYLGCAAEALTVANLPPLDGRSLDVRSYCACCYAPIEFEVEGLQVRTASPPSVAITSSPWAWGPGTPCDRVCDAFHFVLDADHAREFDRQIGARSVVTGLEQLQRVAAGTAKRRMRDPDWGPIRRQPADFIRHFEECGVDVGPWK